ncbi:hypothetical protein ACRCUN_13930 [Mycobacterium sp. LTG2003]
MKTQVLASAFAAMLAAFPASGCALDPLPVATPADVDRSDPDQVIANAMQTMFTWNPTRDASPNAAYERAAIYLSDDLAKQADSAAEPRPGSQWDQWRLDNATVAAQAYFVVDETPPNSADEMHRVVVIVQSAMTEDRRLIDEIRHTAWITATNSDDGWRVTSIEF